MTAVEMFCSVVFSFVFFFKQKTAYEMRISDWSSDVCSSDLAGGAYTVMEPVGVVAAIVPWNAPLNLSALKVAPALAAGCSVILKVAPSTPLDALIFAECLDAAGLPEGVVSVLPAGNEAADALVRDSRVDKVTFTGSTAVGRHIAGVCGDRIARVALELSGKSAAIILDDMPIDDVVTKLLPASTTLSGQACSALTRVIVPRHRHDDLDRKSTRLNSSH